MISLTLLGKPQPKNDEGDTDEDVVKEEDDNNIQPPAVDTPSSRSSDDDDNPSSGNDNLENYPGFDDSKGRRTKSKGSNNDNRRRKQSVEPTTLSTIKTKSKGDKSRPAKRKDPRPRNRFNDIDGDEESDQNIFTPTASTRVTHGNSPTGNTDDIHPKMSTWNYEGNLWPSNTMHFFTKSN
jgi:hypothetical protein